MYKFKLSYLIILLLGFSEHIFSQLHARGMDFDDESYQQVPKKARLTRALDDLPSTFSLKAYAPYPKSQENYGTCAAWASAYCGRTMVNAIKNNWTDRDYISKN